MTSSGMLSLFVPNSARSTSPSSTKSSPSPRRRSSSCREMRDRSGSLSLSPRAVIPLCRQLTPSQVMLIRKSWRHINTKGLVGVFARCFQRLEAVCPVASQCFAPPPGQAIQQCPMRGIAEHAKSLTTLIDGVVEGVRDEEEVRDIGARHAILKQEFGLSEQELDRLQEFLVDVLLRQDGIKQNKETCRAWRILICTLADAFRDGFDHEVRLIRRKSSFNAHTQYFDDLERRTSVSICTLRKGSLNDKLTAAAHRID